MTSGGYDVIVYGATSAGVCAAVAAAGTGATVALAEPRRHVGGMTSGGLGYTDLGDLRVLGGLAARFRQDVADHYGVTPGTYAGPEPGVAEAVFRRWLEEAAVDLLLEHRVTGAEVVDGVIRSVRFTAGTLTGAVLVDASYEGDLLAAAGVPFAVGREGRSRHGEPLAGRQEMLPGRHAMPPWISPFADDPPPGVEGTLLPQLRPGPPAAVGDGDGGVMAYGYRVCLTTAPDRIPVERRAGYDDGYFELARRLFHRWERDRFEVTAGWMIGLEPNLPHGKCDANSLGPLSLNVLDGTSWEYPTAGHARRAEIRRHHRDHTTDFLWFLTNDPAVPARVRREMSRWGLPPEEFPDTGHLPHQLYVREARRMIGDRTLTEADLRRPRREPDVVAMGSYNIDVREVQRTWRWVYEFDGPRPMVFNEGYLSVPVPPYPIPYRCLVPRREDCRNLLVPVCLSASHIAFASVRMEVQYQMLGHAAGLAAASAARAGEDVQDVDVPALQEQLRAAGQVLELGVGRR
ncbi:FAD-dependent oxidoreductase [Georgenia alba]|uniref:FAD-dependent oxidoreductase n=1 Tax=Georgenia alba TaxID=2233858 RepID=A0ABW2QF01_9MICO